MFSILFKAALSFILSFIILSMPISKKPLFYHLTDLTGPLGNDIKESFSKSMQRSVTKTQELGTNLFTDSSTKHSPYKQRAILNKRRERIQRSGRTSEELRHAEKKALDQLIKK